MSGPDGLTAVGHYLKPIKHNGLTEKITVESNRDVRNDILKYLRFPQYVVMQTDGVNPLEVD